jgi:excisionase family DNA binding protein
MSSTEYMTIKDAAAKLGVTRKVIRRMIRDGTLTANRHHLLLRGPQRIPRAEVEALLAGR